MVFTASTLVAGACGAGEGGAGACAAGGGGEARRRRPAYGRRRCGAWTAGPVAGSVRRAAVPDEAAQPTRPRAGARPRDRCTVRRWLERARTLPVLAIDLGRVGMRRRGAAARNPVRTSTAV